jgi:DNA-binding NarL/FixJ family response regulator
VLVDAEEQPELDSSDQILTPREIAVLRMIADGLGNKEIASKLKISDHTVKFHISSIFAKLGAANRAEAVTLGIRLGVIMV